MSEDEILREWNEKWARMPISWPAYPKESIMVTIENIRGAYSYVLDIMYPGNKINMPALVNLTLQRLDTSPGDWRMVEDYIREVVKQDGIDGLICITKGKNGGVCRPWRMTNLTEHEFERVTKGWTQEQIKKLIYDFSVPAPVHPPVNAYIQSQPEPSMIADHMAIVQKFTEPKTAINDHTCPCCGNDKVSRAEKSCWKCGGSL